MSLLRKSIFALGLLLTSVITPSGIVVADSNSELQDSIMGCKLQYSHDCTHLGFIYADGRGVTQDYAKAAEYFTKGCELNDSLSCGPLGHLYATGQGVTQDYAKAAEYFTKGCELNEGGSCGLLGHLYYDGRGVIQDYAKAAEYFRKKTKSPQLPLFMTVEGFSILCSWYSPWPARQRYG